MTAAELKKRMAYSYSTRGCLAEGETPEEMAEWMHLDSLDDEELEQVEHILSTHYVIHQGEYVDRRSYEKKHGTPLPAAVVPENNTVAAMDVVAPVAAMPHLPTGWRDTWEQWLEAGHLFIATFEGTEEETDAFIADIHSLSEAIEDRYNPTRCRSNKEQA